MIPLKKQVQALQRILTEVLPPYYSNQLRLSKMERKEADAEYLAIRNALATLLMSENGEPGSFLKRLEEMAPERQSAIDCAILTIEENSRLIEKNQRLERLLERIRKGLIRRGLLKEFEQEAKNEVENAG